MRKFIKAIAEFITFIFTGFSKKYIDEGLIDLSGEGRNQYGQ